MGGKMDLSVSILLVYAKVKKILYKKQVDRELGLVGYGLGTCSKASGGNTRRIG
jgi:hypothetical protein